MFDQNPLNVDNELGYLHPQVIQVIQPLLEGRADVEPVFEIHLTVTVDKEIEDPIYTDIYSLHIRGSQEVCRTAWGYHRVGTIEQSMYHDAWRKWE